MSKGVVPADARLWRVTILIDDNYIVKKIYQEVAVGSVGFENGHEMDLIYRSEEYFKMP